MTDTVRESSSGKGEVMENVVQLRRCTCAEVEGEDPDCPIHELTIEKIAAWEDWECATSGDLDSYTARRVAQKHLAALTTPDRARAEVLEEAARVAECQFDERPTGYGIDWTDGYERACRDAARTIRALAHTPAVSGQAEGGVK